jgi:hypothetical protein
MIRAPIRSSCPRRIKTRRKVERGRSRTTGFLRENDRHHRVFNRPGQRKKSHARRKAHGARRWRMTKGNYRFDPTLMAAITDTPLDADVPVDVLCRLPEWCIYLELGRIPTWRGAARGVWLSLERAGTTDAGPFVLQLLLDTERELGLLLSEHSMLTMAVVALGRIPSGVAAAVSREVPRRPSCRAAGRHCRPHSFIHALCVFTRC